MNWFLYDTGLRHEKVKQIQNPEKIIPVNVLKYVSGNFSIKDL